MSQTKIQTLRELFQNTCELLCTLEKEQPYPSFPSNQDVWEDDIRECWTTILGGEPNKKETQVFEAVLAFRKEAAKAAYELRASNVRVEKEAWDWLLTTKQLEQRSDEWITEKVDVLTASEIGDIWVGPGSRARLILSKVPPQPFYSQRHAVRRKDGHAMDWGVRYEPVVKMYLEKTLNITISELGRIRHPTVPRLAASPDGLITKGSSELLGRLVEIKCPPSREINETIPFGYWCQMQIQMEVCNLPACEYVECKILEVEATDETAEGFLTLLEQEGDLSLRYLYHEGTSPSDIQEGWRVVETYGWKVQTIKRRTVLRDNEWFRNIQKDIEIFWKDVESARAGTFVPPPSRVKKVKEKVVNPFLDD